MHNILQLIKYHRRKKTYEYHVSMWLKPIPAEYPGRRVIGWEHRSYEFEATSEKVVLERLKKAFGDRFPSDPKAVEISRKTGFGDGMFRRLRQPFSGRRLRAMTRQGGSRPEIGRSHKMWLYVQYAFWRFVTCFQEKKYNVTVILKDRVMDFVPEIRKHEMWGAFSPSGRGRNT